jgi:hypothetical protein
MQFYKDLTKLIKIKGQKVLLLLKDEPESTNSHDKASFRNEAAHCSRSSNHYSLSVFYKAIDMAA